MEFLFDIEWIRRIIAFLFPNPFGGCDAPEGSGCLPAGALGL